MKKFVTMMLVVILVTSLSMAQAEMRCVGFNTSYFTNPFTGEETEFKYWVTIETDYTDEILNFEVDKETYEGFVRDFEAKEDHLNNRWYIKTWKWCSTAAADVADFVTFWN